MSKYTTELRFICESVSGLSESEGYNDVQTILTNAAPKIFSFNFPIFDENYRLPLEIKILKHFYTREIGAETYGLFKLWLDRKMNEIMPYYNEKYSLKKTAMANWATLFNTTNMTTTRSTNDSTVSNSTGTSNSDMTTTGKHSDSYNDTRTESGTNKNAYSETPQGTLSGVESNTYLTDYRKIEDNNNATSSHTENGTENGTTTTNAGTTDNSTIDSTGKYIETVIGKSGGDDYLTQYKKAYDSLVNIDLEILGDLDSLFMGLW